MAVVSVESTDASGRVLTVKSTLNNVGWKQEYRERLENFVLTVNHLTTHTFQFARYIFLTELHTAADQPGVTFPIQEYATSDFFAEVFLSLTTRRTQQNIRSALRLYRELIFRHRDAYLQRSRFIPVGFEHGQQVAVYEGTKVKVAYLNSVKNYFGSRVRMVVNNLMDVKARRERREAELREEDTPDEEIRDILQEEITQPATRFKLAVSTKQQDINRADYDENPLQFADIIQQAYPEDYQFQKDSIYYDVHANPSRHLFCYFKVAEFCENREMQSFQCFPLRKSWIPSYVTIDTTILRHHILLKGGQEKLTDRKKKELWNTVLDIERLVFKDQGPPNQRLRFQGTLQTDGVGFSIAKERSTRKRSIGRKRGKFKPKGKKARQEEFQYIHKLDPAQLPANNCVYIDPGRRDLLYCMHDDSTAEEPWLYRYTANQKDTETKSRKYRRLREDMKPEEVQAAENELSRHPAASVSTDRYNEYLDARAQVEQVLRPYYTNHTASEQDGTRDGLLYLFRKLKFSAIINQHQADHRLAKTLREKFGDDATLIMGNWSAPNQRYHEPVRGVGMRRQLRKMGFTIFLIDEYLTSSLCPIDGERLEKFKTVPNPRPYRREQTPTVLCHGLLRYIVLHIIYVRLLMIVILDVQIKNAWSPVMTSRIAVCGIGILWAS